MIHFALLLIIVLFFLYWNNSTCFKRNNNTSMMSYIFIFIILGLLSALKASTIGNDTPEYIRIYEIAPQLEIGLTRYETGYVLLNSYLYKISSNPQFLFVITTIFVFFTYGRFIWKYSEMPWLSIVLFFLLGNYAFVMSALRQSLALCFLLYSFECLINKRYIYYAVLVLLASTFHSSALLFFCTLPLSFLHLNKKTIYVVVFASILSLIFFSSLLSTLFEYMSMYERYTDSDYFQGNIRFASVLQLFISIVLFIIGYKYYFKNCSDKTNIEFRKSKLLMLVYLFAVYLYMLCLKVNLIDRFAIYFSVFSIVIIPNAVNRIQYIGKKRTIVNLIIIFYIIYTSIALIYRPN